jgi:phosphoribosylglycinamide formyltransferase 1
MNPINLVILGSTRGTDLQYIIDSIESRNLNAKINLVLSNKQEAYILQRSKNHNLNAFCIESKGKKRQEYDQIIGDEIAKYDFDIIVLIGYMRILSDDFVDRFEGKIINVHPSLLPKFAGGMDCDVHEEVIKSGEKTTGCTVHIVSKIVDGGQILLQKSCEVLHNYTPETLKARVQELEGNALVEVIAGWIN